MSSAQHMRCVIHERVAHGLKHHRLWSGQDLSTYTSLPVLTKPNCNPTQLTHFSISIPTWFGLWIKSWHLVVTFAWRVLFTIQKRENVCIGLACKRKKTTGILLNVALSYTNSIQRLRFFAFLLSLRWIYSGVYSIFFHSNVTCKKSIRYATKIV